MGGIAGALGGQGWGRREGPFPGCGPSAPRLLLLTGEGVYGPMKSPC